MYVCCCCTRRWIQQEPGRSRAVLFQCRVFYSAGLGSRSTASLDVRDSRRLTTPRPPFRPVHSLSSSLCSLIYLAKVPNDLIELHSYRSSRRPAFCATFLYTLSDSLSIEGHAKHTKRQRGGFQHWNNKGGPICRGLLKKKRTRLKNHHVAATWRSELSYIIMGPVISGESVERIRRIHTGQEHQHIRE
jgi:hypothetical protein